MKLILSRKGFDSSAGGCPNPVFPDGSCLALPIPDEQSPIRYSQVRHHGESIGSLVSQLTGGQRAFSRRGAHLDPDVIESAIPPGCQAGARCLASIVRPRRTWPIIALVLVIFFCFLRCSDRWNVIVNDGALCQVADRFTLSGGAGCRWQTSGLWVTCRQYRSGRAIIHICMASDQYGTVSMSAATGFRFQACVRICQLLEPCRLCQTSTG